MADALRGCFRRTMAGLVLLGLLAAPVIGAAAYSAPTLGEPFPIADDHPQTERFPAVAQDTQHHRFLVVFQDNLAVTAVCLSGQGQHVMGYNVTANGSNPDVVYNEGHDQYLIVWQEGAVIRGARLPAACEPGTMSPSFAISGDRTGSQGGPRVAYNSHGAHQDYLVVWADYDKRPAVWARRVSAIDLVGPSFAVADEAGYANSSPDVAYNLNHNEYLVVYVRGNVGNQDIYGRRVHNAGGGGLLPEQPIDTSSGDQRDPVVAAYHLNQTDPYLVVYFDYWNDSVGDVRGYLCNGEGQPVSLLNIATVLGRQEMMPAIASAEPLGYTVVWQQTDGPPGGFNIYGRRVMGEGVMLPGFEVSIGSRSLPAGHYGTMPAVAGGSPSALVVWHEGVSSADLDVFGRLLGYRLYLPLTLRG